MKIRYFFRTLYEKTIQNDIFSMANAVTYKLILGTFPFLIFIMTLISYINLDINSFILKLAPNMPAQIFDLIQYFVNDVVSIKSLSLLSTSLLLALYSSTAAIHQMIKVINRLFSVSEIRGFFITRLISLILLCLYSVLIIILMYGFVFGDKINAMLFKAKVFKEMPIILDNLSNIFFNFGVIFIFVILLYKFSVNKYITLKQLMPGVIFTVIASTVASNLFNIYVSNFSRYSIIYGSIGVIFIFALWLNVLTYVVLFGAQINSVLMEYNKE